MSTANGKSRKGLYRKARPSDPNQYDWITKVKIGGKWENISLGLLANDGVREVNVRESEFRRSQLITEIASGSLSQTLNWLTPRSIQSITAKLSGVILANQETTWEVLTNEYCDTKRKKTIVIPNKINPTDYTDGARRSYCKTFREFIESKGLKPKPGVDMERMYIEFVETLSHRSSTSIEVLYSYILPFGDWLAKKGLCKSPDRAKIQACLPDVIQSETVVPSVSEDLNVLRTVYKHRYDYGSYFAAWSMLLLCRGLGCRPDETLHLSTKSIYLSEDRQEVQFVDPKEQRRHNRGYRSAPILFEWVRSGIQEVLDELKKRDVQTDAFVVGSRGECISHQTRISEIFGEMMNELGLPKSYRLKRAQKAHIQQLRSMRMPDNKIARWTGHTMEIYEKHYVENETFERLDRKNYEEFGQLSEFGRHWFGEWGVALPESNKTE